MSECPKVTVFMPVYNGMRFLASSIDSILQQTFRDFEFLIIDDGSTDGSADYLENLSDPRIRVIRQAENLGIRRTYNNGLSQSKGTYIAIMDQDDLSIPTRLERQFEFMESHPDVGLCGTQITLFGDRPAASWVRYFSQDDLKIALLFENPVCHPSVMLRARVLREHGLEYPDYPFAEEYALWFRIAAHSKISNLADTLLQYRTHPNQVSRRRSETQSASARRTVKEQLLALGVAHSARDLVTHSLLGSAFVPVPGYRGLMRKWADRLLAANGLSSVYPPQAFESQLRERVAEAIYRTERQLAQLTAFQRLKWRIVAAFQYLLAP